MFGVARKRSCWGNFCGARSLFGVFTFVLCMLMCVFGVNHVKMGVSYVGLLVFCVNFVKSAVRQATMLAGIIYSLVGFCCLGGLYVLDCFLGAVFFDV